MQFTYRGLYTKYYQFAPKAYKLFVPYILQTYKVRITIKDLLISLKGIILQ